MGGASSLGGSISVGRGSPSFSFSSNTRFNQTFSLPQSSPARVVGTGGPSATGGSIGIRTRTSSFQPDSSFSFTRNGTNNIFSASTNIYNRNGSSFSLGGDVSFGRTQGQGFSTRNSGFNVNGSYTWNSRNGVTTNTLNGAFGSTRGNTSFLTQDGMRGNQLDRSSNFQLDFRQNTSIPVDQNNTRFRTTEWGVNGGLDFSRSTIRMPGVGSFSNGSSRSLSIGADYFRGTTNADGDRLSGFGISAGATFGRSTDANGLGRNSFNVQGRGDVYLNPNTSLYVEGSLGSSGRSLGAGVRFSF